MQDPYKILAVSPDASDEEIKKSYRALSRKYHPDANINNPNKEQAEAKFKEVQQAYDQIMNKEAYGSASGTYGNPYGNYGGFGGFGGFGSYQQSSTESGDSNYMRAAANYINSGRYSEALNTLKNCQYQTAQWHYYSAVANSGVGNTVTALEHAEEALRLDPSNLQYQLLVNQFRSGGEWYQNQRSPYRTHSFGGDNFCLKLCIANMICNLCFGGGGMCCGSGGGGYI